MKTYVQARHRLFITTRFSVTKSIDLYNNKSKANITLVVIRNEHFLDQNVYQDYESVTGTKIRLSQQK